MGSARTSIRKQKKKKKKEAELAKGEALEVKARPRWKEWLHRDEAKPEKSIEQPERP